MINSVNNTISMPSADKQQIILKQEVLSLKYPEQGFT